MKASTYSISGVFSPSVVCQNTSTTGLDQKRPVATLLLPFFHTFQDGLHTGKVVGVRTGDDDVMVGSGISEFVILFQRAKEGNNRNVVLSGNLEGGEAIDLCGVSDEDSDLGGRCVGSDDGFEDCASDVAGSTSKKDGFSRHICYCGVVFCGCVCQCKWDCERKGR